MNADAPVLAAGCTCGPCVLAAAMPENDAGAGTVGEYLAALARRMWEDPDADGERPFGYSGWRCDVYAALGRAGMIRAGFDEDGYVAGADEQAAGRLVRKALAAMTEGGICARANGSASR